MAPLTLDFDQDTSTNTDAGEYDRWEQAAYYAPEFEAVVHRELDRLAALEPNWDAEGAPPINPQIIQAARDFISRLPENIASIPAVVPSGAGTLQFEWNEGPRTLELEIETPSMIHYLKWDSRAGIEEEDLFQITDIDRAASLIRWFMGGVAHV
jgi:hypothetical protein